MALNEATQINEQIWKRFLMNQISISGMLPPTFLSQAVANELSIKPFSMSLLD